MHEEEALCDQICFLKQGKAVFFHTCGYAAPILEDLREIGVNAVWPQLTAYDMEELAARLRRLGLACAIHVDRANVMTHGTPADVTRAVHAAAKAFDVMNGGAYFYVETDNGFPLENIRALLEAIGEPDHRFRGQPAVFDGGGEREQAA